MKTIAEIETQLNEDFSLLESWEEKYDYLIELGLELPEMEPEFKTDANLVKGCQSNVWLATRCEDDRLFFDADSDSLIVKGLVAVLSKMLSGQPASQYRQMDLSFFDKLGFWRHLSSQRSNGLTAMVSHLKLAAEACAGANPDLETSPTQKEE
ncbi:MAG: SufE family protein [Anaerolineaceae bacterium]